MFVLVSQYEVYLLKLVSIIIKHVKLPCKVSIKSCTRKIAKMKRRLQSLVIYQKYETKAYRANESTGSLKLRRRL